MISSYKYVEEILYSLSTLDLKPDISSPEPQKILEPVDETTIHPAFRRLIAKCDSQKFFGIDSICTEFIQTFLEVFF